eukprot:CAMPEP_0171107794 /NCGR_PEP_ID=MMETSP0766_2-20121228/67593_1 /TAXON_ID=439317 /ORGANISM="Gambierdiscus australes, Strain CAWD 149" /LENGTH=97 /DNA_ID=CAMNT_0011569191 /DNA_START=107 /DNA_END=396 /DNA_ORIENTATION=+
MALAEELRFLLKECLCATVAEGPKEIVLVALSGPLVAFPRSRSRHLDAVALSDLAEGTVAMLVVGALDLRGHILAALEVDVAALHTTAAVGAASDLS